MKEILIKIDFETYILQAPEFIVDNITKYRKDFLKWLYDKNNDHNLWVVCNGKKIGVSYTAKDFVAYLNGCLINDKKNICNLKPFDSSKKTCLPTIFF